MAPEKSETPSFTTHNFDAVNDYIRHLAQRHRAWSSQALASTFAVYAKWGAIAILALGAMAFMVLWGVSLLWAKPEPRIVQPIVVDKPVTINLPDSMRTSGSFADAARTIGDRARAIEQRDGSNEAAPDQSKAVVNFVIFRNIPFARAGLDGVTVGMKYDSSTSTIPSSQWCYVKRSNPSGTETVVHLATWSNGARTDLPIGAGEIREIAAPATDIQAAQRLCVFE